MSRRFKDEFWLDAYFMGSAFYEDYLAERVKDQKRKERQARNRAKAGRLLKRLQFVRDFDVWKATEHIEPDFFGDNTRRFNRVKQLHAKKNRIWWVLNALYHYWAFDYVAPGTNPKRGLTYSKYCKVYMGHKENHKENVLQAKWDAKRAKVRERRAKQAKRDAMRDMGINGKKKKS